MYLASIKLGKRLIEIPVKANSRTLATGIIVSCYIGAEIISIIRVY